MRRISLSCSLLLLGLGAAFSCVHGPPGTRRLGEQRQLTVVDTLPPLLAALQAPDAGDVAATERALLAYEAAHAPLLDGAGVERPTPDQRLTKLAVSREALVSLLRGYEQRAGEELTDVASRAEPLLGSLPRLTVAFAVLREDGPQARGTWEGQPLIVFNARSMAWTEPFARRTGFAQAVFLSLHRERLADSQSLGELATRVWRTGAGLLATRVLVPDAREHQVLAISEEALPRLRQREAVIARELLASLDSASPTELARFFDPEVKDPILPPGAGAFISDRIYQRLAAKLGSTVQPLFLDPNDFLARARPLLVEMAQAR